MKHPSKKSSKQTWKAEIREEDMFMDDATITDLIIPIIGITGVGKSTFINALLGEEKAPVGHGLSSHTNYIQHLKFYHPDYPRQRIILIDTPGFDHTSVEDTEILRRIAVWLARSYSANMKLAGIVYLHDISQTNMPPVRKNLEMFQKLCGSDAIKNVILATTKWSDVPPDVGDRREDILKEQHWKPMIELGSTVLRFDGTQESAWSIIGGILIQDPLVSVWIQNELVDHDKVLAETEAGAILRFGLQELLDTQKTIATRSQAGKSSPDLQRKTAETYHKFLSRIKEIGSPRTLRLVRWMGFDAKHHS